MFAAALQCLAVDRAALVNVVLQQPVRHHVGVAADGRSEVRIPGKCQAKMPQVFGAVPRLRHGAHGQLRKHSLLGLPFYLRHKPVHRLRQVLVIHVEFIA